MNLLLLCIRENADEIGDLLLLPMLGDGEGFRWRLARRIKVVAHLRALDLGQHNSLPHEVVLPRELLLGWGSDGHGIGRAGGGRGEGGG